MDNKSIWDSKWMNLAAYSRKSGGNRWAFSLIRYLLKKADLDAGGGIIDVGCGVGSKTAVLAEFFPGHHVYGIDFSEEGIRNAQKYYKIPNLHFYCGDAASFEVPEKRVELLTTFSCLEHIKYWEPVLEKLCNMTGNYLLISVPTGRMRPYEKAVGHYRNFKRGQIEAFMESRGFIKVDVLYAGFPFYSPVTRDLLNGAGGGSDDVLLSFNPAVHQMMYILYRYFSFKRIGDEFYGLFQKEKK